MKIRYVDTLPIWIPYLKAYPRGIGLQTGKEINVEGSEARILLKLKNGKRKKFETVNPT